MKMLQMAIVLPILSRSACEAVMTFMVQLKVFASNIFIFDFHLILEMARDALGECILSYSQYSSLCMLKLCASCNFS